MGKLIQVVSAEATPASAATAIGTVLRGLLQYEALRFDVKIVGGTGGALDVYLQRALDDAQTVWRDFVHFPQVAAGVTKYYSVAPAFGATTIVEVGDGIVPALAANTVLPGHPGQAIRLLYVGGASTSAAGAVDLYAYGWNSR